MRYIFFTFSFIFFSVKKVFFSKKIFNIKLFFHIKTFFSANNVYFVKNTNIFSKKNFFFNLVLQQMNNHRKWIKKGKTFKALRTSTQRGIGCSRPEVFCEKDVLRNLATS